MEPKEALEKLVDYTKSEELVKEVYSKVCEFSKVIDNNTSNQNDTDLLSLYYIMDLVETCCKYSDVLEK